MPTTTRPPETIGPDDTAAPTEPDHVGWQVGLRQPAAGTAATSPEAVAAYTRALVPDPPTAGWVATAPDPTDADHSGVHVADPQPAEVTATRPPPRPPSTWP